MSSNYCVMAHLETDDSDLKTDVLVGAPSIFDNKVWAPRLADYEKKPIKDGVYIEIRFKTEADATAYYDAVVSRVGSIDNCYDGSYIHVHECYIPGKGCEIIKEVKK